MNGRSKGQGIILFETVQDAKNAIAKFNQYEWSGRKLEVREVCYYLGILKSFD